MRVLRRDILGLLGDAPSPSHTTRTVPASKPSASPSARPSGTPSLPTSTAAWTTPWTGPAAPTAVETTLVSTPSVLPVSAEGHSTDQSDKTWQIIGIAIIAVLFVATAITCAMFFDRLCRFLKDVVCCTSHPLVSEEFIPDCEKLSWDARTLSPSPSDAAYLKGESLREDASAYTTRPRELPWNTDAQDCNTLRRQPSRRNDHAPTA